MGGFGTSGLKAMRDAYGLKGFGDYAPTAMSAFQNAYPGVEMNLPPGLSGLTPGQLQKMSQSKGYMENLDPNYARQSFFQDPSKQYQHAQTQWRAFNQNLSQNWWDAAFRDRLQKAGMNTPYMRFTDFAKVQGYNPSLLESMGSWYEGGRAPDNPDLNVNAIKQALGYSTYAGPQQAPNWETSNPQATQVIFDFAKKAGGAGPALSTFQSLSANGRSMIANQIGVPEEAIMAQLKALAATPGYE